MLVRRSNLFFISLLTLAIFLLTAYSNRSSISIPSPFYSKEETAQLELEWETEPDPDIEGVKILPIDLGDPKEPPAEDGITFVSSEGGEELATPVEAAPPRPNQADPLSSDAPSLPILPPIRLSSPNLKRKLLDFLARPVRSYEDALARNIERCPLATHDRQVNPDQLKGERENWRKVSEEDVRKRRQDLVDGLEAAEVQGEEVVAAANNKDGGKGIVVAGGNRDTTARLLTLLRILRNHLHSTLPVQVFHFPGEITSESEREEIRSLGGELVQFEGVTSLPIWKNFQIKALSILKSSFTEVLYLDSDNIPLRDPSYLFDEPLYLNGGRAVFWPDLNKDHPENAIFRILGEDCEHDEWQLDSGQILIDKRGNKGLNLAALHLAAIMQKNHEFWFKLSGGDKDTFRYAFHILSLPWSASPRWLSSLGSLNRLDSSRFCGNTMLQYTLSPPYTPLFLHANLLKHTSGVGRGSTFTHIKTLKNATALGNPGIDGAKGWVYQGRGRGMCVDVEIGEEWKGEGEVETVMWEEGGGEHGLEDLFFDNGGKTGGW